jgi:2-iminobutanoate/2-iminopropanoate deaminase
LPIAADGTRLGGAPFEHQVQQVLGNVSQALIAAGTSVSKLVQVRVYLIDIKYWQTFNELYAKWAGASRPARAVVPVSRLHYDFLIEMEATALQ